MATLTEPLRRVLTGQGRSCRQLGSPFSGDMLELLAGPLEASVAPLLAPWADADLPKLLADATALRVLGALHWLVLTGAEPVLARHYPPQASDFDGPVLQALLPGVIARRRGEIERFMEGPPQTNEVRRSLALVGGFLALARDTGLPLRCLEIGASAGLNQSWDRYRYSFSEGATWGDPSSPVHLEGDWRGPPPALAAACVAERAACDVAPVDLRDPDRALRLQAYVWPDQLDRMERLRAAIAVTLANGVQIERADAAPWVAKHFSPKPGVASVLFHSVMWQYMPDATQAAVRSAIDRAGAAATPDAPVAWLRMEPLTTRSADMEVRLTLWPSGAERLLARAHPHGAWVEWLDAS